MPMQVISNTRVNYTVVNETITMLIIRKVTMASTGFYWVKGPGFEVCNTSLNVLKGMCDNEVFIYAITRCNKEGNIY